MKKIVLALLVFVAGSYGADMFPAYVDKKGVMHKNWTTIPNAREIKEFGLYRYDKKEYPTKMRIKLMRPCFIIDPEEWASYKKIDPFTVEVEQLDEDYVAGFEESVEHAPPLFYNDDLPEHPVYLLGEKGCEEAPNAVTITAYQKISGRWVKTGEATFLIQK